MRRTSGFAAACTLSAFLAACGSEDESTDGAGGSGAASGGAAGASSDGSGAAGASSGDDGSGGEPGALEGECPSGFSPVAGQNDGFESDGIERRFHVLLPDDVSTPRPVFVALTGTVQEELSFAAQSGLDQLPADGWIVLVPVRTCSQNGTPCSGLGMTLTNDGRIWEPWYDGESPATDDEGPDVRFVESAVRCIATEWPVDERRIYAGGISAGGSFTNRILTFNSDFFAGGLPASGNWYNGLVAPASQTPMDSSIVIIVWGGPTDYWPDENGANYDPETKLASQYYAAQPEVVTVSCSGTHGHIWPADFTAWGAETLLSHPKGTSPDAFTLTEPPGGFSCVLGEYTDH